MDWNLVILYLITWWLSSNCHFILAAVYIFWWVVSNIFSISHMGCQPSHWRTHIFQDGRYTTNQLHIVLPITHWYSWFFGHGYWLIPGGPGPPWGLRFVRPDGLAGDKHDARQYFNSFLNQCGKVAGAKGLRRVCEGLFGQGQSGGYGPGWMVEQVPVRRWNIKLTELVRARVHRFRYYYWYHGLIYYFNIDYIWLCYIVP